MSGEKCKLASVKHRMYHPELPTMRHMDRDDTCMMLPSQHCRTTTRETGDDFLEKYGAYMNPKKSDHKNFWSGKYTPKDEETRQLVVNASLEGCREQKDKAVTLIEYQRSDGTVCEKKQFPFINPTGVFQSQEKGIKFQGYPIRQYKASIAHGWVDDLGPSSEEK